MRDSSNPLRPDADVVKNTDAGERWRSVVDAC